MDVGIDAFMNFQFLVQGSRIVRATVRSKHALDIGEHPEEYGRGLDEIFPRLKCADTCNVAVLTTS